MAASFFFYDLETSGFNAREARIMQFAGQRTDMQLKPIGEPVNLFVKMTDDVLPDPDAVLITGITPQQTLADGLTEAEFLRHFTDQVATPDTIFLGFNTVRFDDEFVRNLHYRNFYDPYEWQWQDGRSKWDLLDVVRMTRALRPDGIQWPFDSEGRPTNRLELLTGLNKLEHAHAHDALSDVEATIAVARLIRSKQQKLFDYLLSLRDKRRVEDLVTQDEPFVYTSGKYSGDFQKTTVAYTICPQPQRPGVVFVYDLRVDPTQYQHLTAEQLADLWRWKKDTAEPRLPVKTLTFNKCPAVAPVGVLDDASWQRIQLSLGTVKRHLHALREMKDLEERLCKAWEILEGERPQQASLAGLAITAADVDGRIYDGFFDNQDKQVQRVVRAARPEELDEDLAGRFKDERLKTMLPLYKARNFRGQLTSEERTAWEQFRTAKLLGGEQHSRGAKYFERLQAIAAEANLTDHQRYLLEELQLYGQSILPE